MHERIGAIRPKGGIDIPSLSREYGECACFLKFVNAVGREAGGKKHQKHAGHGEKVFQIKPDETSEKCQPIRSAPAMPNRAPTRCSSGTTMFAAERNRTDSTPSRKTERKTSTESPV